tara:strand:+ start:163 stop:693 length:531 start_codon:yes stop_codon:yes gene_type:complete
MLFRIASSILLISTGLFLAPVPSSFAQEKSSDYKVLASQKAGLNLSTVKNYIQDGDDAMKNQDLDLARKHFDKARVLTKQLLGFYRDLNGAFRGIDARIPREMDSKGREASILLAKTNLRLAALFRRQKQSEVAVPLLVEVIRLMSPTKLEGQKAYQSLLELGFVETPYAGMSRTN